MTWNDGLKIATKQLEAKANHIITKMTEDK